MHTERKGAGIERSAWRARSYGAVSVVAILLGSLRFTPAFAQGTAFSYTPGKITIKAAVLTVDPSTPNPNLTVGAGIMEGLRRASFRPPRWDIINPRGSSGVGAFIPEGSPAYWEVVVAPGVHTDLSGYHLLYLCTPDLTVLDAFQVDSLVEAVNEGAVLWIDEPQPAGLVTGPPGAGTPWANCPFYFNVTADSFRAAFGVTNHALLTRPFRITPDDALRLGVSPPPGVGGCPTEFTWDLLDISANAQNLHPLLYGAQCPGGSTGLIAAAGRIGSGGIVVTAGDVGSEIARWTDPEDPRWDGGAPAPSPVYLRDPLPDQAVDVMFGYNVIAWATGWTQSRQSARGAGAAIGEVRADLDIQWQSLDVGAVTASPVIDERGRVFVVAYAPTPTLYCFDSHPSQDLDGDMLADDGVADYSGDGSADLIWFASLPSGETPRSSGPTTGVAILGAPPAPTDVVLVSSVDPGGAGGTVSCFDAATGAVAWRRTIAPYGGGASLVTLSTPVIHNAYVYVLSSEYLTSVAGVNGAYGRVHCFDLATGGDPSNGFWWTYPDPAMAPGNPTAAAQYQRALPPVDDPQWVVDIGRPLLPPVPTPTPSVGNAPRYPASEDAGAPTPSFDPHLSAVIYFGTPASRVLDTTSGTIVTAPWGSEFALVPAPANGTTLPAPDPFAANRSHYRIMLDAPNPTAVTSLTYTYESSTGAETVPYAGAAPTLVGSYAQYTPPAVETFLASIPAGSPSTSYYDVQTGARVLVVYSTAGGSKQEFDLLPGPVLFCQTYQADMDSSLTAPQAEVAGQRRAGGQSLAEELLTTAISVTRHPEALAPATWGQLGRSGSVVGLHPGTGEKKWEYDPRAAPAGKPNTGTTLPTGGTAKVYVDGPPADAGSVVLGAASQPVAPYLSPDQGNLGRVFGLNPRPDLTIRVRVPIPAAHPSPHAVRMTPAPLPPPFDGLGFSPVVQLADGSVALSWDADPLSVPIIDPACYEVDYANRRIIFPAESADNVRAVTIESASPPAWSGTDLGPVWGRMLIISFAYDANSPVTPNDLSDDLTVPSGSVPPVSMADRQMMVYHAPDLARFHYSPGMIRLRYYPVVWTGGSSPMRITLANGVSVSGVTPGESLVTFGGIEWLPTGLLNADTGVFGTTGAPLQRGADLFISYEGVSVDGQVTIPNAYEPPERHQVPYSFGRPLAGVVAANDGQVAVIGTESMNLDGSSDLSPDAMPFVGGYSPAGFVPDPLRTLLALEWNKVTNYVRGRLLRPAEVPPTAAGVPVVSGSPAVEGDTIVTGSRMMAACPDHWSTPAPPSLSYEGTPGGPPFGFVSRLAPVRTLITDNERIVETVGSEVDWECTGTRTLDGAYANLAAESIAGYPASVPPSRKPFSRPAKAVRLTLEDYLATYVTTGGVVQRKKLPTYDPENLFAPGPIPDDTPWPPPASGVGPGNYLVVDTGNNRVVEVDRKGRQVWPLANYPLSAPVGSRRPDDHLGFDFYTHPTNTTLDLEGPTDAHRYMSWNSAAGEWEMHTVIADPGHYRVIDVVTTFGYSGGDVTQTHTVVPVTPPVVRATTGPRKGEYVRVAYTRAQPLFHPYDGTVIGYLCAANNLHELLVIEAGTKRVNPPGSDPLPCHPSTPPGSNGTWAMWSWLYEGDSDGDMNTDERLIFENIRHVQVSFGRDEFGGSYLFLTVVCGQYRGPLAYPVNAPGMPFAGVGPACLEFRVGNPVLDPTAPSTWVLLPSDAGAAIPYWSYTEADFAAGPLGHLWTPPGEGAGGSRVSRAFVPVCAQRLSGGRHLIVNSRGIIENLTHPNVPTATDAATFNTPPSLAAEVFEVETHYAVGSPNDPATQTHIIDLHKVIPDPWLEDWADPINQPSFAHRCLESLTPLRP